MEVDQEKVRESLKELFENYPSNKFFMESKQLYAANRPIPQMIQAFSLRPEIMAGLAVLSEGCYPGGILERQLGERVLLALSRMNECQFCASSHEFYIKALGISDTPSEDLDSGEQLTDRDKAALDYARAIYTDSNKIPEEIRNRVRELFTEAERVELTFTIGIFNTLNWFNNALENQYLDEYEGTVSPADLEAQKSS